MVRRSTSMWLRAPSLCWTSRWERRARFRTRAASGLFTTAVSDAGADGQASKVFTLIVNNTVSGLTDAVTNEAVTLSVNAAGTLVTGSSLTGGMVFTIAVAADGSVTVNQFRALEHNDSADHDENTSPDAMLAGIIDLKVVLTDGDGDTATDKIDLGSLIKFEDDGPAKPEVTADTTHGVTHDESSGVQFVADPNAQSDIAGSTLVTFNGVA